MEKVNSLDLFLFSIRLGLKAILAGKITKEAVKRILCPMDPPRYYELPRVANSLSLINGSRILDISSPKLLVYFLAIKHPKVNFYSIDKYEKELENWKKIIDKPKNLIIMSGDATELKFRNNFFDEIYSISVIEHIDIARGDGDTKMIEEVFRVLKENGKFIFTTIISNKFTNIYRDRELYSNSKEKKKSFFCRIYNYARLKARVLDVEPHSLFAEEICNYNFPFLEKLFNRLTPFSAIFGTLYLPLSYLMIHLKKSGSLIKKRAEYFGILVK